MRNSNKDPGCISLIIAFAILLFIIEFLSSIVRYAVIIIAIIIAMISVVRFVRFISGKISEHQRCSMEKYNTDDYEYDSESLENLYDGSDIYASVYYDVKSDAAVEESFDNIENYGYLSVDDIQERYQIGPDLANEIMNFLEQLNLVSKEDSNNLRVLFCEENVIWYYVEGSFENCNMILDPKNDNINESEDNLANPISNETTNQNHKTYNFQNCTRYFDADTYAHACNAILHKEDMQEWYGTPTGSNESHEIFLDHLVIQEESSGTNVHYDDMSGHDFEYYCADLLRKNDFSNVVVTQGSSDHGIDILAEKDNITYAIQCKCYASNIGNDAIQQAHAGKCIYLRDIAVVITNRFFTQHAIEEANVLGVKLWNRNKLNELIHNSNEKYENSARS